MVDILISLAEDIKFCLLGALGIGAITGYLFTKLRVREEYIPVIFELEDNIYDKERKIDANKVEKDESIKLSKNLNEKLSITNGEVTKFRDITTDLETKTAKSKTEQKSLKNQYSKQENILDDYNTEMISLTSILGLSESINPDERKATLKTEIETNEQAYKNECNASELLENQNKELEEETSSLSSKLSSLTSSWDEKDKELSFATNSLSTLREELQKQYDELLLSKQENDERIDRFKKQLIDIKNRLS
jgi:chromosome segregation ATPase